MTAPSRVTDAASPSRPDELLVALPHVPAVVAELGLMGVDARETERSDLLGLALLTLTPGALPVPELLRELRRRFAAEHAGWRPTMGRNRVMGHVTGVGEISYGGQGSPEPADPPAQWSARGVGPGEGARVGILDTGLSPHSWLSGGWVGRHSDILRTPGAGAHPRREVSGHATFVAGLVLHHAPGATVEARRVLEEDGTADSWSVAKAIAEAGQAGLDVLNLSLVCFTEDGRPPLALATAIDRVAPSTVVVAAAGNHGNLPGAAGVRPAWPAALDDVVAVGAASEPGGGPAKWSPDQPWVDLLAPGVDLVSTYLDGPVHAGAGAPVHFAGFARWSGTSFAAALTSGVIAAGVRPGRVSAQESWSAIRAKLDRAAGSGSGSGAGAGPRSLVPRTI